MKDFLLLSNINAITYKEFFPLLKEGKVNTGYVFNKTLEFETPEGEIKKQTGICWYATFPVIHKHLVLTKTYNPQDFQTYDNYNAINVDKVKDIPYDYEGVMGVPITIFQYDLDDVEVEGLLGNFKEADCNEITGFVCGDDVSAYNLPGTQNGPVIITTKGPEAIYKRILIRRKQL